MEIFELRYFLAVAEQENVHRASEKLHVSPASLSKAITRLEDELSVKLFSRDGRNIKLTDQGHFLQLKAQEIVQMEESVALEISGHKGAFQVVLQGAEILLGQMGVQMAQQINKKYPLARILFVASDDESALRAVLRGQAHIAFTTEEVSSNAKYVVKNIGQTSFQTYVGPGHPLFNAAKSKKIVTVEEVLKFPFVSPSNPLLGKVGKKQSLDGWRDDEFPRKIGYQTSSLKTLEQLLIQGQAVAYLPDYFTKGLEVLPLKISGCPYSCHQKIRMVIKRNHSFGWLNQII